MNLLKILRLVRIGLSIMTMPHDCPISRPLRIMKKNIPPFYIKNKSATSFYASISLGKLVAAFSFHPRK